MKDLGIILGIRPDVIRASKIIKLLSENKNITYDFIWSGQHYSENMKDVFFKQLNVPKPDVEFEIDTTNDASTVSSVIKNTFNHLENHMCAHVSDVFLSFLNYNLFLSFSRRRFRQTCQKKRRRSKAEIWARFVPCRYRGATIGRRADFFTAFCTWTRLAPGG